VVPTDSPPSAALKLRAEDEEDLAVISACLQDALVSVRDLAYDPAARTFMLVANRFRWENGAAAAERVLCGLAFSEIGGVSYRGFRRSHEDRILSLLAIRPALAPEEGLIRLDFAAGAEIRLTTALIRCYARDLGEPWPTPWRPEHSTEGPA
jgi:Protein of unknown function (DUF2948)